jgi:hypothetical protein
MSAAEYVPTDYVVVVTNPRNVLIMKTDFTRTYTVSGTGKE